MTEDGLTLVLLRNEFYRDNYHRVVIVLLLAILVNLLLALTIVYKWTHPPQPQYFPTTSDGRMILLHPLTDPAVSDDFVIQWATNAVSASFSLDYVHWRAQLQTASNNFTPYGWQWFLKALESTNNLKTLTTQKMVSDASITGAPQITQKAILDGHYAWKVEMPILVTYSGAGNTIQMPMHVILIVIRVPVQDYPQRIAINNFIAEAGSKPEPQNR